MSLPFTAEDVASAYQEIGVKPCQNSFSEGWWIHNGRDKPMRCCGITSIAVKGGLDSRRFGMIYNMFFQDEVGVRLVKIAFPDSDISHYEAQAFMRGFDGKEFLGFVNGWEKPGVHAAYREGVRAWQLSTDSQTEE